MTHVHVQNSKSTQDEAREAVKLKLLRQAHENLSPVV